MGGFFQALGAGLGGAGEAAGPYRDKTNASNLRVWENGKADLLKSAEHLIIGANDPEVRNRLIDWHARASRLVPGDKNQAKMIEELQQLGQIHPELAPMFESPKPKMEPGSAPGVTPGMMRPAPTPAPAPNPTGDFASMLAGPSGSWMGGQSGPAPAPPTTAQPATSPVQGGSAPMPDLTPAPMPDSGNGASVSAPAPHGSGSPTYDRLSVMPFVTPMQMELARPIIQAELQAAQHAVDAETNNAQEAWKLANTTHGMTPGMELVGGDGKVIHSTPKDLPLVHLTNGAIYDPNKGKDVRQADLLTKVGTPFNAAYQQFVEENSRVPTTEEINQINRGLRGGDPLYVTMQGGVPTYTPRGAAIGAPAARTTYDITGLPSTGGQAGVSMQAPPPLDAGTQTQLTGLKTTIDQATKVNQLLNDPAFTTLGPALGRVKLAEIEKLGGLGATPKQIQLATALKRLLSTNAFAQGGKNLTETELSLIKPTFPQLDDTLEAAITKTRDAIKFYNQFYQDRVRMMSPRQQGQVPTLQPPPNAGGGPVPKTGAEYLRSIGMGQ